MQKLKAPYWIVVAMLGIGFFDGALGLGLPIGLYFFTGIVSIGALVWMGILIHIAEETS